MELNKCPNCSGKLALAKNRKRLVCSYCGSEFPLDEITRSEIGDQPVNPDWFIYDWDIESIRNNKACDEVVKSFIRTLNDYEISSAIEAYMREYLMDFDDVSAYGIREEKLKGIAGRLARNLLPEERIVLYYDDGILIHGKTGIVVTDKRTFFVEMTFVVERDGSIANPRVLRDIGGGCALVSHFDLVGALMALICAFAFEERPDRPKIKLVGSVN